MTVLQELQNRGQCRYNLSGVLVATGDDQQPVAVDHTYWDSREQLVLALADGSRVTADQAHLRSRWPSPCCTPALLNEFNDDPDD